MNGFDKVKLVEKFDNLSNEQKQELYGKYGQSMVDKEMSRCRLAHKLVYGDVGSVSANELLDAFTNVSGKVDMSNRILKDLSEMQ